jgi:trk system potassium uptake protein
MINTKLILHILGTLLFIEAALLALCLGVSALYGEDDLPSFVITIAIASLLAFIFKALGRYGENRMSRRDGYVIVSFAWVLFSLIGMLPFTISGYVPSVTDAFFETMSGFTTTGASVINNIETLPHGLLFWRSLTHWIGGLGIVFFTIAILPNVGSGDMRLFSAEATGPLHDKLSPRISTTAKWLWTTYLTLTIACALSLCLEGMSPFDSICHSFACTATGGFSTHSASVAYFHSPLIEYTLTIFMLLSGVNFSLLYAFLLKIHVRKLFVDTEFRWYLGFLFAFTSICTICLVSYNHLAWEPAFRKAAFQIVSLQTTTGFITDDYMKWCPATWPVLLMAMLIGACSGSTTGGMKVIRVTMLIKSIRNELQHILHPNAVLPIRINNIVVSGSMKSTLMSFAFVYISIIALSWIILMFMGLGFMESISVTISSISNVGPGMGTLGPTTTWATMPALAKWYSAFLMLIGRLEIFSVILLFSPRFWTKS